MHKTLLCAILCPLVYFKICHAFNPSRTNNIHKRSANVEIMIFPDDEDSERHWPKEAEPVDPFDEKNYSEEEKKCLSERKFLVMGKCYALGSKGPCAENELLLLNKPTGKLEGIIRPVCKVKLCNGIDEVWWPKTKKCEQKTQIKAEHCKEKNKSVILDPYGEGICSCAEIHGLIANNCYEYYQRGPCNINEIVTYNVSTGETECSIDKCWEENNKKSIKKRDVHHIGHYKDTERQNLHEKEKHTKSRMERATEKKKEVKLNTKKLYAPFEGVGKCFELGSSDPCTAVDKQSKFIIDRKWYIPRCSITNILHVVDAPVACRLDHNNRCREQVEIEMEDRLGYLSQMKRKLKAGKKS